MNKVLNNLRSKVEDLYPKFEKAIKAVAKFDDSINRDCCSSTACGDMEREVTEIINSIVDYAYNEDMDYMCHMSGCRMLVIEMIRCSSDEEVQRQGLVLLEELEN